jgi:hypothetical protein
MLLAFISVKSTQGAAFHEFSMRHWGQEPLLPSALWKQVRLVVYPSTIFYCHPLFASSTKGGTRYQAFARE